MRFYDRVLPADAFMDRVMQNILDMIRACSPNDWSVEVERIIGFIKEYEKINTGPAGALFPYPVILELIYRTSKNPESILPYRQAIWSNNYGVPTLEFSLINRKLISDLLDITKRYTSLSHLHELVCSVHVNYANDMVDVHELYAQYDKPLPDPSGSFIVTANKQGFMTTRAIDPFSVAFINTAEKVSKNNGIVLEIGAAYGVATLEALSKGATVVCNDIEPIHLAVIVKEHMKNQQGNLITAVGAFPHELVFNEGEFDAILISRVLHFFDGEQIVHALKKARYWLKKEGKLFVVNETPYLSNWCSFLEEYNIRKSQGDKWPGIIKDTKQFEQNRSRSLPSLVHWLDRDTLSHALLEAGFNKDEIQIEYINRESQFPSDLLMPEEKRESVGCVARKTS